MHVIIARESDTSTLLKIHKEECLYVFYLKNELQTPFNTLLKQTEPSSHGHIQSLRNPSLH